MDFKHRHEVPANATVCLADYCEVLHCDWFQKYAQGTPMKSTEFPCIPWAIPKLRKLCDTIAYQCFQSQHGPDFLSLRTFFITHFCDAHTCDFIQHTELLTSVVKYSAPTYSPGSLAIGIVVLVCFVMFYGVLYVYWINRPDVSSAGELRAARSRSAAYKVKNY